MIKLTNVKNSVLSLAILLLVTTSSYVQAQFEYLFPYDGSCNNFPNARLIVRNGAFMDPSSVTADKVVITGSESGVIESKVVLSTDGKTVCITPKKSFAYSEAVTVTVKDGLKTSSGMELTGTTFGFSVRREMTQQEKNQLQEYLSTHDSDGNPIVDPHQQSVYVPHDNSTVRGSVFDSIIIYTNNNASPGRIFFHRNSGATPQTSFGKGYGVMESNGDSVFYRASKFIGENFRINLNGYLSAFRLEEGADTSVIVMDSSYNQIDELFAGNGLAVTQHEHLLMPDGTKWFTIYDWQGGWDLQAYGGSPSATVNVSWIQKLDKDNNVVFEWRSDHDFAVTDATIDISLATATVDPWHVNAIHAESDGSVIVSLRNMDRVIKINPSNGSIVWQWGGPKSTYTDIATINDPNGGFSHQHHVQRISNGNILLFDNGNLHSTPISRPKEYTLNETNLTATCVWYYTHPQVGGFNMHTKNQGSVMRMPNGNTFIGYGLPNIQGLPNGTEIDADENIVWEFRFKDSTEYSYRVYKFEWSPVGINDIDEALGNLKVFPNPSNGLMNLEIELEKAGYLDISVFNLLGQRVYNELGNYHRGMNGVELDLTSLIKGFYILEVSEENKKMVSRILIQ